MDNEILFYVLGGALVVIALVVSFAGLRFDKFPGTKGILVGGTVAVAVLVVATAIFAWRNAEDEQAHHEAELAEAAEASEEEGDTTEAEEEEGSEAESEERGETTTSTTAAAADGAQLFASEGCTGCHTLADAGSTTTTGPVLDSTLKGADEAFIRESIVDPNAEIAQGFQPDIMPQTYEDQMSPEELDALVQYLAEVTTG